jgi:hypothetical protein
VAQKGWLSDLIEPHAAAVLDLPPTVRELTFGNTTNSKRQAISHLKFNGLKSNFTSIRLLANQQTKTCARGRFFLLVFSPGCW